jgi:metal-sulfur cluster biosynthetic enzyme
VSVTPEELREALREVEDPEIGISIVDLGLLRGIEVEDETGNVKVALTLTSPACPLGPELMRAVRECALRMPGVTRAEVELVWRPPWDPRLSARSDTSPRRRAPVNLARGEATPMLELLSKRKAPSGADSRVALRAAHAVPAAKERPLGLPSRSPGGRRPFRAA